jgi:hypothetical protein
VLYEIEHGVFRLTGRSHRLAKGGKLKPITEYLSYAKTLWQIDSDILERTPTICQQPLE